MQGGRGGRENGGEEEWRRMGGEGRGKGKLAPRS